MSSLRSTAALLAATAMLLGACTQDTTDSSPDAAGTDAPADADTTADAGAEDADPSDDEAAGPVETDAVDVVMFRYRPEVVRVDVGTTVTFVNLDNTEHTVTAGSEDAPDPDLFDLPLDVKGDEGEFTFDEAGTYEYYCVIHPFMVGTVEVS